MPDFDTLVKKYKKRSKDNLVDQVSLGLSYAESVTADAGLLTDTGVMQEVLETAGPVLPKTRPPRMPSRKAGPQLLAAIRSRWASSFPQFPDR